MSSTHIDVGEIDFQSAVLDRSFEVPVVVDFWAPWCGPCGTLGPVLEDLAARSGGRWVLAKVNVDENPAISQALRIQGIPAVKAFVDGKIADEFTGALPKEAVEEFLSGLVPSHADDLAREAAQAIAAGDETRESEAWEKMLEQDPADARARLGRARVRLKRGDAQGAREDLAAIPADASEQAEAERLAIWFEWGDRVKENGGPDAVRRRAAERPDDPSARYDLGGVLATSGDFAAALVEFLEVVRLDRKFGGDAGRRAMLALFTLLGDASELTREYRGRLSSILF